MQALLSLPFDKPVLSEVEGLTMSGSGRRQRPGEYFN
jgi:hypothetical protein